MPKSIGVLFLVTMTLLSNTKVFADDAMRKQCYEEGYSAWSAEKTRPQERQSSVTAIGGGLSILGQVLGEGNSGERPGKAATRLHAAAAEYGLFELAPSQGHPASLAVCRRYYQEDARVARVRLQSETCTTRRFYSYQWGNAVEYFETTCQTGRFYSYERNPDIWSR